MAALRAAPSEWPRDASGMPKRRAPVGGKDNTSIYWRPDGRLEIGYRDSTGRQRWELITGGIMAARGRRDEISGAKRKGERVQPNPRLRFGEAADRWLAEQVADLRPATQASSEVYVRLHLKPRWGNRRMDSIDVGDAAKLVRELRAQGYAEWTISGILRAAGRVFKFASRSCHWHGENPFPLLEKGERPRVSDTPEPRPYEPHELAQTIAAAAEPWRTLFRLAGVVAGRESELLGLWWQDLDLEDLDAATIRFGYQLDRKGRRVELKTDESKAVLPLPRSTAVMLLEHRARSLHAGPRAFVFATRTGKPLGQRNVLRALYRAQQQARDPDGRPTFPELFEHDERGHLAVDERGRFVPRKVKRRELELPDFHALRHTAAMDCEDAEEARDLLRHKNSNVTRAIYRAHFGDRRREQLRARMEARMEAADGNGPQKAPDGRSAEVVDLQRVRHGGR
jgi:integrase